MVRLVNALLADAVQMGASDIHFEPEEAFLRIRYRIDGVLRQVRSLHKSYWPAMVVRLKVVSGMDIAESQYVPPEIVTELSTQSEKINLEGESKYMTVLFCDLQNFSGVSEQMSPRELVKMLNDYFNELTTLRRTIHSALCWQVLKCKRQ